MHATSEDRCNEMKRCHKMSQNVAPEKDPNRPGLFRGPGRDLRGGQTSAIAKSVVGGDPFPQPCEWEGRWSCNRG